MSTPKHVLVVILCTLLTSSVAQQRQIPGELGYFLSSEDWMVFDASLAIPVEDLFAQYDDAMGLGTHDAMVEHTVKTDHLGWSHHTFQQTHRGIPVDFAVFKVHAQNGIALKGNGQIARNLNVNTDIRIPEGQALALALDCIGAESYHWEHPTMEHLKQHATGDPDATFYPNGQLVIADADFNPDNQALYSIAWKFEIYAHTPDSRSWVYVDALSGEILKDLNLDVHETEPPGTAETRYSGLQTISTDTFCQWIRVAGSHPGQRCRNL